jgi:hypothetical protein
LTSPWKVLGCTNAAELAVMAKPEFTWRAAQGGVTPVVQQPDKGTMAASTVIKGIKNSF